MSRYSVSRKGHSCGRRSDPGYGTARKAILKILGDETLFATADEIAERTTYKEGTIRLECRNLYEENVLAIAAHEPPRSDRPGGRPRHVWILR